MAILTNSGRAAVAEVLKDQPIHLAWGSGDPDWDTVHVPEPLTALALEAEIGRRVATQAQFCKPDANGEIIVPNGQFAISAQPTNYLFLRFTFDFADASAATIRELGVFIGTEIDSSVPSNQQYFLPADVVDPGRMLLLERIPKLERSPEIRQQFEFVVQF